MITSTGEGQRSLTSLSRAAVMTHSGRGPDERGKHLTKPGERASDDNSLAFIASHGYEWLIKPCKRFVAMSGLVC